jgi:glutathione reductase (NADPH)
LNKIYAANVAGSGIDYVEGMAKFTSANSVEVEGKEYTAKHILIASGATPARDNFKGSELCIDSNGFFEMTSLPESVVVLGGGYIAVELGQMLSGLGVKDVSIVARSSLLKFVDSSVVEVLEQEITRSGVKLLKGNAHTSVHKQGDSLIVTLENGTELKC